MTKIKKDKNNKRKKFIIILLSILIIAGIGILIFQDAILSLLYPRKYSETVKKYSTEFNVDPNLVYAVIKAESNFNENATSSKGAKGLMQLMDSTAKDVAKKANLNLTQEEISNRLLDVELNICIGTKYLQILQEKYQNIELALTAYNAGIGTVDNWIEKGILKKDGSDIENVPYKETNNYVRKIMRDYKIYSIKE